MLPDGSYGPQFTLWPPDVVFPCLPRDRLTAQFTLSLFPAAPSISVELSAALNVVAPMPGVREYPTPC